MSCGAPGRTWRARPGPPGGCGTVARILGQAAGDEIHNRECLQSGYGAVRDGVRQEAGGRVHAPVCCGTGPGPQVHWQRGMTEKTQQALRHIQDGYFKPDNQRHNKAEVIHKSIHYIRFYCFGLLRYSPLNTYRI